jgi:hypothetical protein
MMNLWEQLPPRVEPPYDCGLPGPSFLLAPHKERKVIPYLLSATLHGFAALVIIVVTTPPPPSEMPREPWKAKATIIRLPQHVFMPKLQLNAAAAPADATRQLTQRANELISQLQGRQPSGAAATQKSVVVDALAPAPESQITLIQPQYPLNMPPPPMSAVVPSAMVWNDPKPTAAPRRVIVPGPAQREAPVVEMRAPSTDIRSSARIVDVPESIRVNAAALPIAQPAPSPNKEKQPAGGPEAHPVSLLSVSDARLTSETIVVPPGNVIPSASDSERSGARRTAGESASASSSGNSDAAKNQSAAHPDHRASTSDRRSAAREGRQSPGHNAGTNATPDPVASPSPLPSAATPLNSSASGTRDLVHPPNGRFDIVVIQSAPDESLPAGLLSGKPVYTVYLHVGDLKQWVMHFCATNSSPVRRGGVVQLPDPRPLTAPYPRVTARPEEPVDGPGPYVLVRGTVDANGSLQNLQVISAMHSSTSGLLDALSRWKFNPAKRAESPETVEMVLAIPIHKTPSQL